MDIDLNFIGPTYGLSGISTNPITNTNYVDFVDDDLTTETTERNLVYAWITSVNQCVKLFEQVVTTFDYEGNIVGDPEIT